MTVAGGVGPAGAPVPNNEAETMFTISTTNIPRDIATIYTHIHMYLPLPATLSPHRDSLLCSLIFSVLLLGTRCLPCYALCIVYTLYPVTGTE